MSAQDFLLLWSNPLGIQLQSSLLVYLCNEHKDTNTLISSCTAVHWFCPVPLKLLYLSNYHSMATYLPLSLIRKHPRQVWTSFTHSHLYIHVYYVFMLNTKTCIMKAADLSCSSRLHCSRYTILSQLIEPKRVRTWQYEIFKAWVKRVRKDDTPMNLNSQFNSSVKCFSFFPFSLLSMLVKMSSCYSWADPSCLFFSKVTLSSQLSE